MKLSRKGMLAAGILAVISTAVIAAGNWSTLPIVGQPSFCVSTVTGAGAPFSGITGQGQGTTGAICAQTVPAGPPSLTGNELVPADTGSQQPATVTIPSSLLANFSGTPRNYLDNGAIAVTQRGTGITTCAANAGQTLTTYSADRWGCSANVGSGAGRSQVVTASPAPPAGFVNSLKLYRNSAALTQPVCAIQEIATARSTYLAGKTVTLSANEQALAGLAADNGNLTTMSIIYGTGTEDGLGTMTASPAITPAWTGIAFAVNQTVIPITTSWGRYSVTGAIPATATEVGVEICFTPTATGAGTTDGFAMTGIQLEVAPSPSAFEYQPFNVELAAAQRYYTRFAELAATYPVDGFCQATGATTNSCTLALPQPMRSTPVITITTAGTFKVNIAGTLTTIATPTAGNCGPNACIVTAANTNTAGQVEQLTGAAGGTGVWEVSADF